MQIGIVGLGKMGANMARRLGHAGHSVIVYNRTTEKAFDLAAAEGNINASSLLDLTAEALAKDQEMDVVVDWVDDSGEDRWTVLEAIDQDVPVPVITLALIMRFVSRQEESYSAKILATMRNQFCGHKVKQEL